MTIKKKGPKIYGSPIYSFDKMTRFAREVLKRLIVNYYGNVANSNKNSTVKHFKAKQIPKSTIYSVI